MRVTIIKDNGTVTVDGESYPVDCSGLPADFHALQWDGASGEIEYRTVVCSHCGTRSKKPNLFINDMTPYLPYVDAWTVAKETARVAHEKAIADAKEAAEKQAVEMAIARKTELDAAVQEHMANAARSQG